MKRWKLSYKAEADLEAIYDYSFEKWGLNQAEKYTHDIHEAIVAIAASTNYGRSIDNVKKGYRKAHINRHFIIYKTESHIITVNRILHEKMDVKRHL